MLRTRRLLMRPWTAADLEDACRLWSDPAVMALLGGAWSRAQVEARLAREKASQEQYGVQYWKLIDNDTGEMVGCCGIKPNDLNGEIIFETGFHLARAHWGKGYATEALERVVGHAFEQLRLPKLYAGHHPMNNASKRVLEKLGFKCVGERFYEPTGLIHPWYELLSGLPSRSPDTTPSP
jgi:RimJ/RimL family protein N-acetyltransferase